MCLNNSVLLRLALWQHSLKMVLVALRYMLTQAETDLIRAGSQLIKHPYCRMHTVDPDSSLPYVAKGLAEGIFRIEKSLQTL